MCAGQHSPGKIGGADRQPGGGGTALWRGAEGIHNRAAAAGEPGRLARTQRCQVHIIATRRFSAASFLNAGFLKLAFFWSVVLGAAALMKAGTGLDLGMDMYVDELMSSSRLL